MVSYIVTGGTGFLGRRVVQGLLDADPEAIVHVLVRAESLAKFTELAEGWHGGERVFALVGDLTAERLGLRDQAPKADHIVHLGAVYDMTADEAVTHAANVAGTRSVIALARELGAVLHHVSSVAVAGDHKGKFFEEDFDLGQNLTSPYHRTKFAAEQLVRESRGVRWRVYRPAIVVGDSRTGEMDKIDGPYYFFSAIAKLAGLPSELPMPLPDLGATNIVPVDYVAAAMVELVRKPGLDGRTFHLVNPEPQPFDAVYGALAAAAGAPTGVGRYRAAGWRCRGSRTCRVCPRSAISCWRSWEFRRRSRRTCPSPRSSSRSPPGRSCAAAACRCRSSRATPTGCGSTGARTWIRTGTAPSSAATRFPAGSCSSPGRPPASAWPPRTPSRRAARPCSWWRAAART